MQLDDGASRGRTRVALGCCWSGSACARILDDPIIIGYADGVPRPSATPETERRVEVLLGALFKDLGRGGETIADVARDAGLAHETVRRLLKNPTGRDRSGPGFFVVAAIARARGVSLETIADATLPLTSVGRDR